MENTHIRSSHIAIGMSVISAGILLSAIFLAGAIRDFRRNDTITVTGSARKPIRADFAVWRGSVSSQKPTMQDAYRDIERYTNRMKEFFTQKGVPDTAITWGSIDNSEIQEWLPQGGSTGRILAYRLGQNFEIRSGNVDFIAELSQASSELIPEGIPIVSYSPEYLYTKLAELRVEMLTEATQDAHRRAERIAEGVNNKVGTLRNARMGVFQITPRNSTDVSDWGIYDTRSIDKDITAVVSLTFSIE